MQFRCKWWPKWNKLYMPMLFFNWKKKHFGGLISACKIVLGLIFLRNWPLCAIPLKKKVWFGLVLFAVKFAAPLSNHMATPKESKYIMFFPPLTLFLLKLATCENDVGVVILYLENFDPNFIIKIDLTITNIMTYSINTKIITLVWTGRVGQNL